MKNKISLNYILFFGLIIVDQLLKFLVRKNLLLNESVSVFPFLKITHIQNTGITFGLFQGNNLLMIWVYLIVLGLLMLKYDEFPKKSYMFVMLVIAGLIGNLIDRIFVGSVTDFIDLIVWPVFNLADSLIVVGVIGIIWYIMKKN